MLIRTTMRIQEDLKRLAEQKALDMNTTLEDIFNRALTQYLENDAKKIIFKTHNLGEALDNLSRSDYY